MNGIPFLSLRFQHETLREEIEKTFSEVYQDNWFVLGKRLLSFEKKFAAYTDAPFCLGVGNGLDALTLALHACGVNEKHEVLVPAHTYIATWLAVSRVGARIIPVDAEERTFNMDVDKIPEAVTPRTKVLLPVHMYGQPCNMTRIDQLGRQFGIAIVEDFAQAHGHRG